MKFLHREVGGLVFKGYWTRMHWLCLLPTAMVWKSEATEGCGVKMYWLRWELAFGCWKTLDRWWNGRSEASPAERRAAMNETRRLTP